MSFLQKVKFYHQTKCRRHSSIYGWDITSSVWEKETSAILEFYFRFLFRLYYHNRHVILHEPAKYHLYRPPIAKYNVISILQDGSLRRSLLLLVSCLLMFLPLEDQYLSASKILSTYLNSRLRYYYIWFGKTNVRHIGILLLVSMSTISP